MTSQSQPDPHPTGVIKCELFPSIFPLQHHRESGFGPEQLYNLYYYHSTTCMLLRGAKKERKERESVC